MPAEALTPAAQLAARAKTPFPGASPEYDAARQELLGEEIEFRRQMTQLTEQRRALPPGPVISKNYRFKDEQGFEVGLRELFSDKTTCFSERAARFALFWASEMAKKMAALDIAALWSILDLTPEGRAKDWYPKLQY